MQAVIDEGLTPKEAFQFEPYPRDKLIRRSATVMEYQTPANSVGIGTQGMLVQDSQPIDGVVILLPENEMDLVSLYVRLPSDLRDLAPTIMKAIEPAIGAPQATK